MNKPEELEELRDLAKSAILSLTEDEVKAVLAILASEATGQKEGYSHERLY